MIQWCGGVESRNATSTGECYGPVPEMTETRVLVDGKAPNGIGVAPLTENKPRCKAFSPE